MPLTEDKDIAELLRSARTIAMVGASDNPDRPSFRVMQFLQEHGYRVLPVNPKITGEHVHGEYIWRELSQIGEPIDIVDIFRRSDFAGENVDQAIAVGAKAVWMQLGVIDVAAAKRAEAAGLKVVMDRCPKIEIARLGIEKVGEAERP
ncbi:MAG TPA: CoA-binding protein [Sphingomicrobium sp.]|nr:CoA-binding protein [Sphingomicrobium sp.]